MMRLFLILLIAVFPLGTLMCGAMSIDSKKEVPLRGVTSEEEGNLILRSPVFYPVRAFIDGSDLQLEFQKSPCTIEVNIVNILTGEVGAAA